MMKFEVGDLVRVRIIAAPYHQFKGKVGHIVEITGRRSYPYVVDFGGQKGYFPEDELEKI